MSRRRLLSGNELDDSLRPIHGIGYLHYSGAGGRLWCDRSHSLKRAGMDASRHVGGLCSSPSGGGKKCLAQLEGSQRLRVRFATVGRACFRCHRHRVAEQRFSLAAQSSQPIGQAANGL
ncbi:MAG: hypothetical protein QOE73_2173 [Verrucomicrobiota bacterium]